MVREHAWYDFNLFTFMKPCFVSVLENILCALELASLQLAFSWLFRMVFLLFNCNSSLVLGEGYCSLHLLWYHLGCPAEVMLLCCQAWHRSSHGRDARTWTWCWRSLCSGLGVLACGAGMWLTHIEEPTECSLAGAWLAPPLCSSSTLLQEVAPPFIF